MADGPPDRPEYRKAFIDMVGSARSYLLRCLIVLLLLAVVVEDRLTVLRRDVADANSQITKIDGDLGAAKAIVAKDHRALQAANRSLDACTTSPAPVKGAVASKVT